jgi:hypothetical protein
MHPRILAQRTGIASEKLVTAAQRLAQALDLPEDLVDALMPGSNNSQIKPMLVLEACANLVEAATEKIEQLQMVEVETVIPPLVIETPEGDNITVTAALDIETTEPEPKGKRGRTK